MVQTVLLLLPRLLRLISAILSTQRRTPPYSGLSFERFEHCSCSRDHRSLHVGVLDGNYVTSLGSTGEIATWEVGCPPDFPTSCALPLPENTLVIELGLTYMSYVTTSTWRAGIAVTGHASCKIYPSTSAECVQTLINFPTTNLGGLTLNPTTTSTLTDDLMDTYGYATVIVANGKGNAAITGTSNEGPAPMATNGLNSAAASTKTSTGGAPRRTGEMEEMFLAGLGAVVAVAAVGL